MLCARSWGAAKNPPLTDPFFAAFQPRPIPAKSVFDINLWWRRALEQTLMPASPCAAVPFMIPAGTDMVSELARLLGRAAARDWCFGGVVESQTGQAGPEGDR